MSLKTSIIIPTYNERTLGIAIRSAINAAIKDGLDYEIIVVTSSENPEYWVEGLGAKLLRVPKHGAGEARNAGAKISTGDILVFMDANSAILKGLGSIVKYALHPEIGEVTAPVYAMTESGQIDFSSIGWAPEMDKTLEYVGWGSPPSDMTKPYPIMFACGAFVAIDANKFKSMPVGWIPYWGYEDREIGMRLWRMGYNNIAIPWARFAHVFKKEIHKEKLHDPLFYRTFAKNYAIGALLDFDDDTLIRLDPILQSKGVTNEIWKEIAKEGWHRIRDILRKRYVRDDVEYFITFGKEPP